MECSSIDDIATYDISNGYASVGPTRHYFVSISNEDIALLPDGEVVKQYTLDPEVFLATTDINLTLGPVTDVIAPGLVFNGSTYESYSAAGLEYFNTTTLAEISGNSVCAHTDGNDYTRIAQFVMKSGTSYFADNDLLS